MAQINPVEARSLAFTPTWSVATVLTVFVAGSLLIERLIHRLSAWLRRTKRNPLFEALEKMKEELMLLGFISLLLAATSGLIASICIESKYYTSKFSPCTRSEAEDPAALATENGSLQGRNLISSFIRPKLRRKLSVLHHNACKEGHEPFVSFEGLEQLHRFIFIMAVTHVFYSCLTMLLAIVKIHTWRKWEDEAHMDKHASLSEITKQMTMQRQSTFVKFHTSKSWSRNTFFVWMARAHRGRPTAERQPPWWPRTVWIHPSASATCFFRQFGHSVAHADYLTLRMGFITNHNLMAKYDFHSYMIRSMEEEFQVIVGVSAPLWGFIIAFMLFNINGSNLYFWIAIIPIVLVLLVGTKLQHVIATLALENAGITGSFKSYKVKPRDDLFWFRKPEMLLSLIHFVLFQNSFELASFFWFWMGTNYKAALIPHRIRETIHGWGKAARRKRRHGLVADDSTVRTDTSTLHSSEDDEHQPLERDMIGKNLEIELQPSSTVQSSTVESSQNANVALLRSPTSMSFRIISRECAMEITRSMSMPTRID
ncbi:MLO-like protein 11 isoform X4 [Nymphaea colorata]|uniref:MLO-like protein 11 isoform X4 n=1 Tax=Nymphaea colorata TaxID=210225 RepID=UPI00214E4CBE|nr:MLO-like protein 11 isoform X4 [Nymphaea colorata]